MNATDLDCDMRLLTPGCAIDEFHFELWAGLMRFLLGEDSVRQSFEAEAGATFRAPSNGLEAMIDKATGHGTAYVADFCRWATPLYFGGPEDICPAIAAKLAEHLPP